MDTLRDISLKDFEEAVLYLVREFNHLPLEKTDNYINESLGMIAPLCDLDSVFIYRIDWENKVAKLQNIWRKNEALLLDETLNQIPLSYISHQIISDIENGISGPFSIPADISKNSPLYKQLESIGERLVKVIPLKANDRILGVCVLSRTDSEEKCSEASITIVNIFCEMLTNVLLRLDYERRIVEKNESMQQLLDSANDGISMLERDGTILNINAQFAGRFNKKPDEVIGRSMLEFIPESVYGDLFEQRLKKINTVFMTQEPYFFQDSRDGLWFYNRSYPVFKEGRVVAAALFSTDITADKKLQEREKELLILKTQAQELKKREQDFLEIVDGSTEGNYVVDFVKGTTYYSEKWKKRLGMENVPPELLLEKIHETMEPDDADENIRIRYDIEANKDSEINRIMKIRDGDGKAIWVKVRGKFFYNASGKLVKAFGSFFDITELKEMQIELIRQKKELTEKNRVLTEFFTNISHEFRTPISVLLMKLEQLQDLIKPEDGNRKDVSGTLAAMRRYTYRLTKLVNNLLDITKIDAGFETVNYRKDDIAGIVSELVRSVRYYADANGIGLKFDSDAEHNFIPTDRDKVERILLNLLSNAIKFSKRGGQIEVTMKNEKDKILIKVKDNGYGIPDDKMAVVFDRFRQANTTFTRSAEGCGIGLSLTKGLVELLGGRIKVESKVGEGSIFHVELPVKKTVSQTNSILTEGLTAKIKTDIEFSDINCTADQ